MKLPVLQTSASCSQAPAFSQAPISLAQTPSMDDEFAVPKLRAGVCDDEIVRAALMVTRRCNMACGHCSVESSPHIKGEPSRDELLEIVRDAKRANVRSLQITGGEPMLREALVLELLRECQTLDIATALTTNGFWGRTPERAARTLNALINAGLQLLTVSYDRYHADFSSVEPALNIARAAQARGFKMNLNMTRAGNDLELSELVAPFAEISCVRLRFYDVQAVGRARDLDASSLRAEESGFCNACGTAAITDDHRVTACNGPSYFAPEWSPLFVGSLQNESLSTLLARHRDDEVLETLRTFGPSRLRVELEEHGGFSHLFEDAPRGTCDLCRRINSDADAVEVLRARLKEPRREAAREAARLVIAGGQKRDGALSRDFVNGPGAARLFLHAAQNADDAGARWAPETVPILGRADLDWARWAGVLAGSGLARPLLPALDDAQLTRWAPQFFRDNLRAAAQRDALREIVSRDALRGIAAALRELGTRGVLLKGAALRFLDESRVPRSSCDIDVWVEAEHAPALRAALLRRGFKSATTARPMRKNSQHLQPVVWNGVVVELHTRIMRASYRLPETEMIQTAWPLASAACPELEGLFALGGEALLLHALLHATHHKFIYGLRLAWDVAWILRACPNFDWQLFERWARATAMPMGVFAPLRVLQSEFGIENEALAQFLCGLEESPQTQKRQKRVEQLASSVLLNSGLSGQEAERGVDNAIRLLLLNANWQRAIYLTRVLRRDVADWRPRSKPLPRMRELRRALMKISS